MSTKIRTVEDVADGLARRDRTQDEWRDAAPLRRVSEAAEGMDVAREELAKAVDAARRDGFSWKAIGVMLGITKQAAQQRFGA